MDERAYAGRIVFDGRELHDCTGNEQRREQCQPTDLHWPLSAARLSELRTIPYWWFEKEGHLFGQVFSLSDNWLAKKEMSQLFDDHV